MAQQKGQNLATVQKKLQSVAERGKSIVLMQHAQISQWGIDPGVFADSLVNAVMANPAIANCEPDTVFKAVRKAVNDGIVPNGRDGVLIPKRNGDCTYLPMKEGLARAFTQSTGGKLFSGYIQENDEILELDLGTDPVIRVRPALLEPGEVIAAWAMIEMPDGTRYARLLNKQQLTKARNASAAKDGPWSVWYERMAEKSAAKSVLNANRHLIPTQYQQRFSGILDEDSEFAAPVVSAIPAPQPVGEATPVEQAKEEPVKKRGRPRGGKPKTAKAAAPAPETVQTPEGDFVEVTEMPPEPAPAPKPAPKPAPAPEPEPAMEAQSAGDFEAMDFDFEAELADDGEI